MSSPLNLSTADMNSLHAWLSSVPQQDLDRNLALNDRDDIVFADQTQPAPDKTAAKGKGATALKGRVVNAPPASASLVMGGRISAMLAQSIGVNRSGVASMLNFLSETVIPTLMTSDSNHAGDAKPLTARTLLALVRKTLDAASEATIRAFEENRGKELVAQTDALRQNIRELAREVADGGELARKLQDRIAALKADVDAVLESVKQGKCEDDGIGKLEELYKSFKSDLEKMRSGAQKAIFRKETLEARGKVEADIGESLQQISSMWDKKFGVDNPMTADLRKAGLEACKRNADEILRAFDEEAQKQSSALAGKSPDERAKFLDALVVAKKALATQVMNTARKSAEAKCQDAVDKAAHADKFAADAQDEVAVFKETLAKETGELLGQRWERTFGKEDADGNLKQARDKLEDLAKRFSSEADGLLSDAEAQNKPQEGEKAAKFAERLKTEQQKLKSALAAKIDELRKTADGFVSTEKTKVEGEIRAGIAAFYDKSSKTLVEDFKKDTKEKFGAFEGDVASGAQLKHAREETERQLAELLSPQEGDTPEAAESRREKAVALINDAYVKMTGLKHAVETERYQAKLEVAVLKFKGDVQGAIASFGQGWDEAFPAAEKDKHWLPQAIDASRADVLKKMNEAAARVEREVRARAVSGTMVWSDAVEKDFATALAQIKADAQRQLDNAVSFSLLRDVEGRGLPTEDGGFSGGFDGAVTGLGELNMRLADFVSIQDDDAASVKAAQDHVKAVNVFINGIYERLESTPNLSPYSLGVAKRQIETYIARVDDALRRGERHPGQLATFLAKIRFPEITLKSFDDEAADDAFVRGPGVDPAEFGLDAEHLDDDLSDNVLGVLRSLKKDVIAKYGDVKGWNDPAAVYAFQNLVRTEYAQLAAAVKEAVTNGTEGLGEGIGRIVAGSWKRITENHARFEAESTLRKFRASVNAKAALLDEAAVRIPVYKGKPISGVALERYRAAVAAARNTLADYAWSVEDRLVAMRDGNLRPTPAAIDAILGEGENDPLAGVSAFLAGLESADTLKNLGGRSYVAPAFALAVPELASLPVDDRTYVSVAQGRFDTLAALDTANAEARNRTDMAATLKAGNDWKAVLEAQQEQVTLDNADRLGVLEQKAPMQMPVWADDDRQVDDERRKADSLAHASGGGNAAKLKSRNDEAQQRRNLELKQKADAIKLRKENEAREKSAADEKNRFEEKVRRTTADWFSSKADLYSAVREKFSYGMLNLPQTAPFILRDDDGNCAGWSEDGLAVLDRAMDILRGKHADYIRGEIEKGNETFAPDGDDDFLMACLDEALAENASRLAGAPDSQTAKPRYPLGSGVFGLDVPDYGFSSDRVDGLRHLVDGLNKFDANLDLKQRFQVGGMGMAGNRALPCADFERAVQSGSVDLESFAHDPNAALLLAALYAGAAEPGDSPDFARGFGTTDPARILALLKSNGINRSTFGLDYDLFDSFKKAQLPALASALTSFVGALRVLNNGSPEGLDVLCSRVFGKSIDKVLAAVLSYTYGADIGENPDPPPEMEILRKIEGYCDQGASAPTGWRTEFDPVAAAKTNEKRAVSMLAMQHAFDAGDKASVLALRQALVELSDPDAETGDSRTIVLAGTNVVLTRRFDGKIEAEVSVTLGTLKRDKYGDAEGVEYGFREKTKAVPVALPRSVASMLEELDAAIVNDVNTYGPEAALQVLEHQKAATGADFLVSSRTRQLAIDVLISYCGLKTSDLCLAPTEQLVNIAYLVLDAKGPYPALARTARGSKILDEKFSDPVTTKLLNSNATLELYRRMQAAGKETVDQAVKLPPSAKIVKGETKEQAKIRRLHDFVSDLVQPNDTTKFDLLREPPKNLPPAEILRTTLLERFDDLMLLLDDKDGKALDTFKLKGKNDVTLARFKDTLKTIVDDLRGLYAQAGTPADFRVVLADTTDSTLRAVLAKSAQALNEASTAVLDTLQQAFVDEFVKSFDAGLKAFDDPAWKKTLDELAKAVKIDPSQGYGGFLKKVMGEYFTNMAEVDRNRMAAQVVRFSHSGSSLGEVLASLLKGAGPVMQKLLQGLPTASLPPVLREAVQDLRSKLAPIADEAVRAYLYNAVVESNGEITSIEVKQSLGAASVGQVFLCVVKTKAHPEGEECVVKVLRPDAQTRAKREEAFLRKSAEALGLGAMLSDRFDRVYEELDLMVEAGNVARGRVYDPEAEFRNDVRVQSMKLYPAAHSTTNVLFLHRAPGEPFDRFVENIAAERREIAGEFESYGGTDGTMHYRPRTASSFVSADRRLRTAYDRLLARQKNLCSFVTQWMQEIAFGGGFFHGDVHAGNIMAGDLGLTVIDFGNATRLTDAQRTSIKKLLISAELRNPAGFVDGLKAFMSPEEKAAFEKNDKIDLVTVKKDLADIFDKGLTRDVGKRFIAGLQLMQNAGVKLPGTLFNLMECMLRLDDAVNVVNAELKNIGNLLESHLDRFVFPDLARESDIPWFETRLHDAVRQCFGRRGSKATYNDKMYGALKHNFKDLVRGSVYETLKDSCGTRAEYEKMMAPVRTFLKKADLHPHANVSGRIRMALAFAESDPAFFDPESERFDDLHETFAKMLSMALADAENAFFMELPSSLARYEAPELSNLKTFADAVGDSVYNNRETIAKEEAKTLLGNFLSIKSLMSDEKAVKDRRYKASAFVVEDMKGESLTNPEYHAARSVGENLPFSHDLRVKFASSWWKNGDTVKTALAAVRAAVGQIDAEIVRFGMKPNNATRKRLARILASFMHAEFKATPFTREGVQALRAQVGNLDDEPILAELFTYLDEYRENKKFKL